MKWLALLSVIDGCAVIGDMVAMELGFYAPPSPFKALTYFGMALLCMLVWQVRRWIDPEIQDVIRARRERARERMRS